jgi:protein-L-isoaspartate O-methyltransferase
VAKFRKKSENLTELEKLLERKNISKDLLFDEFQEMRIIEIGSNRGYWTKKLSEKAKSIHVIDINKLDLEIATKREYKNINISFGYVDSYERLEFNEKFDGLFCGSTISSLSREEFPKVIKAILDLVKEGGKVIIMDVDYDKLYNKYSKIKPLEISKIDSNNNRYNKVKSEFGNEKEILRNYYSKDEIISIINSFGIDMKWDEYQYYWQVKFKKRSK